MKTHVLESLFVGGLLAANALPGAAAGSSPGTAAQIALSRCLRAAGPAISVDAPRVATPPGLARSSEVEVVQPSNGEGRLFVYQGTAPHGLACGVALYGAVSARQARQLSHWLDHQPGLSRHAVGAYTLSGAHPARRTCWVDPLAPGLAGALLMARPPSGTAPTLEIDVHRVLVF